ncbi:ribonuclease H protein, partial [Trifolium medium]|nr:ribonuclease H protein [Trifolium medium]
ALRGCLPVKERLIPRGVQCDSKCICCDVNGENEWHCFFGCKAAQEVWIESEFWERLHQQIETAAGFKQLVFFLIESQYYGASSYVTMDDLVASRRNQMCWNDKIPSVFEVRRRARDALEDWLKVRGMGARQQPIVTHEAERKWCKPRPGTLKCNIDAACFVNANQYCIGACIRDAEGGFLKALTKTIEGQPEIREAEAIAMLERLKWLQHYSMQRFHIETDCIQVVQGIE